MPRLGYSLLVTPNRKRPPLPGALLKLIEATAARDVANEAYKNALFEAVDSGGSIREVAAAGKISTRTLQDWLKKRP